MEFLAVIWTIVCILALIRVITSGERFFDRWLRVKEGRPLKEDIINYYPPMYEWSMFRKDKRT